MAKRIISLIIVFSLVIVALISCGTDGGNGDSAGSTDDTAGTDAGSAEDSSSDAVSKAVYERNKRCEEAFNVVIKYERTCRILDYLVKISSEDGSVLDAYFDAVAEGNSFDK